MDYCDNGERCIDKDGLRISLEYFNSSTLTMRLNGLVKMNNYISIYNDFANSNLKLSEQMTQWILDNKLLENIFGPNLHVEVIKQSNYVLSSIAPKITTEHIDIIWSSAQTKHYERYIFEILGSLVRNLNYKTVLYLYKLLWTIKPSNHSEQTLNLASQIIKYIWLHCGVQPDIVSAVHYVAGEKEMSGEDSNFKGSHTLFSYFNRDPPSKESSSSASSVEVSDDEEDEEDFEMDMGSSRMCIDKGPLSKMNSDENSGNTSESDLDELSDLAKEKPPYKLPRNFNRIPKMDSLSNISSDEYKPNMAMNSFPKTSMNESQDDTKPQKEKLGCIKSEDSAPFTEVETPFDMYDDGDEIKNCYNYAKSLAARKVAEVKKEVPPSPPAECITDEFRIVDVTKPGQTLLWDLIHDEMLNQLTEELATAADRIFWSTICCASNRHIRIMFINAALENLSKNNSVITMFRLLQKLFSSFFPYQEGRMTRKLIFDANKQQNMLNSVFNNLTLYMSCCKNDSREYDYLKSKFCTQKEEIQIRLNFLSYIFMYAGPAHENLSFSQEHVNILWEIFTKCNYPEIADEFFDWLLNQGKSHGINLDIIKYILVEKMPLLRPESYSLTSLELLQHLHGFFFAKNCIDASTVKDVMNLVWAVAFNNPDTDVSMAAIRHLNQHYINLLNSTCKFDKEEEFIQKCMTNLKDASVLLPTNCDKSLVLIERAVIMLKNHLEVFYSRYSYYFRKLKLTSDVDLYSHRARERFETTINFYIISPYSSDKRLMEMSSNDCIGELRAEVQKWWQSVLEASIIDKGAIIPDTVVCLVHPQTEQEIPLEYDDKRIGDVFKDNHVNQISFHTCKSTLSKSCDLFPLSGSSQFFDSFKLKNSHKLLLEPPNFELLFTLVQQLDMINISNLKARILSRNIWEIIQILPTSTDILDRFDHLSLLYSENISTNDNFNHDDVPEFKSIFERIFPSHSNQKLIYSCHIVDNFRKAGKNSWPGIFIKTGGLQFLYKLFIANVEATKYRHEWTEWKQDCVSSLLQTIYQFATINYRDFESLRMEGDKSCERENINMGYNSDGSRKNKRTRKNSLERNIVPFNSNFLALIDDQERLLNVLFSILKFITENSKLKLFYQTTISSRAQVVIFNLSFFTSWCYSDSSALDIFYQNTNSKVIIKKLILEASDPQVRKEVSLAFIRLCLGSTIDGRNLRAIVPKFLSLLLSFLEEASTVNINIITANANRSGEEKDYTGPGCKDYFTLVCRLIEPFVSQSFFQPNNSEIDIDDLCQLVANSIIKRESYELYKNSIEDEGLRGLVVLLGVLIKHNPKFKHRPECREFIMQIFNSLFALPTQTQRALPKCRSSHTRSATFDLLVELVKGNEDNFNLLTDKLIDQHRHEVIGRTSAYPWEYWPQEESRSECGFVGLSNLGATCYLASCMQHLFMLTDVRNCILTTHLPSVIKHEPIIRELQKMFIFLQESERKSYNPKSFCKVYTMDHQPLNICEQKDMTEFFTDVISKLEEMTIDLKDMMKRNFSGLQSNNVVSLDCPHISQTTEEFYTLRCQVADMRDLYESLNELTVKDTLEGDNMYNCSKCGKKVRAEKRACIKKLPKILCFNTMRYTFNMITMTKEKVNTHFSFPLTLDMAPYLEKNLLVISETHDGQLESEEDEPDSRSTKYELIGVTVHTGTADGGHYYSFIQDRDPHSVTRNRWFFFNDAEVKPFDKGQLAAECFGGETTSKQYDQTNDKFFDCSIEKTNSAYMLFYERIDDDGEMDVAGAEKEAIVDKAQQQSPVEEVSKSLLDWIWEDNISFLRDQFIFDHNYFDFIWQVCSQVPQTLPNSLAPKTTLTSARLATLFVLETLIHAKEKPTLAQWIELLTKQFNNSQNACEWLIDHMSQNDWWLIQILLKCSNQMVRQLFVRLLIHVITKTKPNIHSLYLHPLITENLIKQNSLSERYATVTRFVSRFISLIDIDRMNTKPCIKNLTEYFHFLNEFAKQGDEECKFLISINAISTIINFYLNYGKIQNEFLDNFSDNEDEDFDERPSLFGPLMEDKFPKMISLDKMITLIVYLLDRSQRYRTPNSIGLSARDFDSLISGKTFQFIQQQIRDNINLRQTFNLIIELRTLDDSLAQPIINMIFTSITRTNENSTPFFKILSFIVENTQTFSYFAKMILPQIWDCCHHCPLLMLDWLVQHVPRNKFLHDHVLSTLDYWVIDYLLDNGNVRVRSSAAQLLISLVPSQDNAFRQNYRPFRPYPYLCKDILLSTESMSIIEKLYTYLVILVKRLKPYPLTQAYGMQKLTNYFYVLSYFFVYSKQKKMFAHYFHDFWNFFSSKLAEPTIAIHQNKQAFLMFLYLVCQECPDVVRLITVNHGIHKKLAFNYILADHDDQDTVLFNKNMLPYYYGALKLCCRSSRTFTRILSVHQNITWAYQNISPYPNHYSLAVKELFELMKLFVIVHEDSTREEKEQISKFKKETLKLFLNLLNPSVHWVTIISVLNILIPTLEDRVFFIKNNGLYTLFASFNALHTMFHEATACHITSELVDILSIISLTLAVFETPYGEQVEEQRSQLKEYVDVKKLDNLRNTYSPASVRKVVLEVLERLVKISPGDFGSQVHSGKLKH